MKRAITDSGEEVEVFGDRGRIIPWGDWFLCDEDCGLEARARRV
jgi:hypothetical protein